MPQTDMTVNIITKEYIGLVE